MGIGTDGVENDLKQRLPKFSQTPLAYLASIICRGDCSQVGERAVTFAERTLFRSCLTRVLFFLTLPSIYRRKTMRILHPSYVPE